MLDYSTVYSATITPMMGYHGYELSELAGLPDDYLVSFTGTVIQVQSGYYIVQDSGATSIKVKTSEYGEATDAELLNKTVNVKGHLYTLSSERIVTYSTMKEILVGQGDVISINFDVNNNGTPPMGTIDEAGVILVANWNDINSAGGGGFLNPTQTFHNNKGEATTLSLSVASGSPDSWNTVGTPDQRLYGDWLSAGAGTTLTLDNVPYEWYDLYVYHSHYAADEVVDYTVGSVTRRLTNSVANPPSQSPVHIADVTYVVFSNLNRTPVSVVAQTVSGFTGIAGFQVVENTAVPEPGIMIACLLLSGLLAYGRNRK